MCLFVGAIDASWAAILTPGTNGMSEAQFAEALRPLGYDLTPFEVGRLFRKFDGDETVLLLCAFSQKRCFLKSLAGSLMQVGARRAC